MPRRATSRDSIPKITGAICAVALIILTVETLGLRVSGLNSAIQSTTSTILSPIARLASAINQSSTNVWTGIFDQQRLQNENEALRAQLLDAHISRAEDRAERVLASLSQDFSTNLLPGTHDVITAPVLSGSLSGSAQTLWIGKGANQGLTTGMVVLSSQAIIGMVIQVNPETALVELVTHHRAVWGVEFEVESTTPEGQTRVVVERGLLKGIGRENYMELHLERTATQAIEGLTVLSSGMAGSVAPGGLPFGIISEVRRSRSGEPILIITPPETPSRQRTVFIIPVERIPWEPGQ